MRHVLTQMFQAVLDKEIANILTDEDRLASLLNRINLNSAMALNDIRDILCDDGLSDFDCVEKIICVLERHGSGGGDRHDFG